MLTWLSSFSAWVWTDVSGVALVFAGVAGGYVTRRRKPLPEPNPDDLEPVRLERKRAVSRRKSWEDAWECMLILGLGVEIIALGHQISESAELKAPASEALKQAGKANERASSNELARVKLEAQIKDAENKTPGKMRVSTASASAVIHVETYFVRTNMGESPFTAVIRFSGTNTS